MKKILTIVALVAASALAYSQQGQTKRTLFGLSKEEFRGYTPIKQRLTVVSSSHKDTVNNRILELLFDSYISLDKLDSGRYIETSEITLPESQGLVKYKVFLKAIEQGTEVTIVPLVQFDAVASALLLGSGETQWKPLTMKGTYNSLAGYAFRGTVMLALCSRGYPNQ